MSRVFSIILAMILALTLVACGSSTIDEIKSPSNVISGTDTASDAEPEKAESPAAAEVTIDETVLVDEDGVKIVAKSFSNDEFWGPEIKLLIENDSGKDLTFQCRHTSVNGYMVDAVMSVDVVNGKKANDSITFMSSDLDLCSIDAIADIELSFHIFDTNDWETYLETDAIQIKTSIADSFNCVYDDSGDLAHDGNDIKIVVRGLAEDTSIYGPSIVVYIENTGDKVLTVQTRDVSINGFMVDPIFSCDIAPGKHAVDAITFMDSDLEANDITTIEEVELSFHIYDFEKWDTIVDTDVVTIAF